MLGLSGKKASAGEVFLAPANEQGPNTFTPNVATSSPSVTQATAPPTSPTSSGAARSVASLSGSAPGLYGGTRDNSTCDAARMVDYLNRNPDKARAWAAVEGIAPGAIADYVSRLTPVFLRSDTRVTNHGFLNGRATSIQTVLQAGTAVLVDDHGIPRVRCACGNPLTEPVPVTSAPRYTGTRWATFNPTTIVVVNVSTTVINNFTLIDVNTGATFIRQVGGAVGRVVDTDAQPGGGTPPTPGPPAATRPSSLQDVVGTYGNLQITPGPGCGGAATSSGDNFKVTIADPARGVVTIASGGETFTGTLASDYSFQFKDPGSSSTLDGRFQRQGGTVTMSGSGSFEGCTLGFTAQRIG